jgi:hypothetical protein
MPTHGPTATSITVLSTLFRREATQGIILSMGRISPFKRRICLPDFPFQAADLKNVHSRRLRHCPLTATD